MDEPLDGTNLPEDLPSKSRTDPPRPRKPRGRARPASSAKSAATSRVGKAAPEQAIRGVVMRFEKRVSSTLLPLGGETLVCAPLQEFRWSEIATLGRGLADVFAAVCEQAPELLAVTVALSVNGPEAQPVIQIHLPEEPDLALGQMRDVAERALNLLGDDALTGLPSPELAARFELDARCINAVKRVRNFISGRRLDSAIEIGHRNWSTPVRVATQLCEPYRPDVKKVARTLRGRFSGFDIDDRDAYLRPRESGKRLEISFEETQFAKSIFDNTVRRRVLDVDVIEESADGIPRRYELKAVRIVQDGLPLDPPVDPDADAAA